MESLFRFIGQMFLIFIVLSVVGTIGYFVLKTYAYIDLDEPCFVWINGDSLKGNVKPIHEAIKKMKTENPLDYSNICQHVTTIMERQCVAVKPEIKMRGTDFNKYYLNVPGCYVAGSKTIYLEPEKGNTPEIVDIRISQIKRYSDLSLEYWQNR